MYSRNLFNFLALMIKDGALTIDWNDELIAKSCVTHDGAIKHEYFPNSGFERDHLAHEVSIAAGSRLRHAIEVDSFRVNSMHHQGVKTLGRGLAATAIAPDGLIEAVELDDDDAFIVGVQWHPEVFEMTDPHTRHLFKEFVDASSSWRKAHG